MSANSYNKFDKEVLVTKKPLYYYLTFYLLIGLILSLILIIKIRQLYFEGSITLLFFFLLFGIMIYANFGQYLAIISLYEYRIEVNYIFPWNKSIVFEFNRLSEVDFKDLPLYSGRDRWYIGGKSLYLINEKGEVCQFKYNINNSDNKQLLVELQKKCTQQAISNNSIS